MTSIFFGHEAQFQRAGRIDDARVTRDEGQVHGGRTAGGDDALLELDDLLGAGLVLAVPSVTSTSMWCGSRKLP
jgi:hypothetical protein